MKSGFRCSDVHKFEKLNNLCINIFELSFDQYKVNWKHILIPIEIIEKGSERVVDLLIYKNHHALIKKLNVFLGNRNKNFICRGCLNSYTSESMLMIHKPKCENYDITAIRTSNDSHFHWKNHFHKNLIFFSVIADFDTDNEIDDSSIGIKTTNI